MSAIALLQQAISKDPEFVLAYCQIVKTDDWLYFAEQDNTPERLMSGKIALSQALRLRSDLPDVNLTAAFHYYICNRDYDKARVYIEAANTEIQNNPEALAVTAYSAVSMPAWKESKKLYKNHVAGHTPGRVSRSLAFLCGRQDQGSPRMETSIRRVTLDLKSEIPASRDEQRDQAAS